MRLELNGDFLQRLEALTLWDGAPLPLELKGELEREYQRLRLVEAQRRALEKTRKSRLTRLARIQHEVTVPYNRHG